MLRTHTCGQLRADDIGTEVTLCGWVDSYRDHGGTIFVDLRDRYGKTQVVFAPERGIALLAEGRLLRNEDVIQVVGKVAPRPEGTVNPKLDTGETEVRAARLDVFNKCPSPPFTPSQQELPGEDLRLRHRYLDLRRAEMQQTLVLRSRIIQIMREHFAENDFIMLRHPFWVEARRKALVTTSYPAGSITVRSTLCPSRLSCTSRS